MLWLVWIIAGYLVGSIPFGYLIGRARGVDIRAVGSGNVGATNVGRVLGRRFGIICFVLDAAKGALPVIAAGVTCGTWGRPPAAVEASTDPLGSAQILLWLAVAVAALLGHMHSPWLGFRGGKGVATGFGGMVSLWPLLTFPALAALVLWVIVVRATRYVSLASIIAAASLPVTCAAQALIAAALGDGPAGPGESLLASTPLIVVTAMLALLVLYRHRANIARLRAGTEPRVSGRS